MAEARRRLAAILCADVAGYSRLMGDDEQATVDTLNAYRAVFREHIGARHGRVVDTAGDSVLAVFDSVVEAVQCASEVQGELETRNADLPETRRMQFRIGVNSGDVIEQADGTVYGDGVNVAARLQALAEPGTVWASETVRLHAEGKLDLVFADAGEHQVKNIAKPVKSYRVGGAGDVIPPAGPAPQKVLDKPSIAVLPFDNLSADPDQAYFADGIAEDLITALSRIRWLFVIARNSTFTYKGRSPDVRQVGRELGVRYVLEGSVRKGGDRIRVTAQLIDTDSGAHVWAERYDRELADVFAVQDEITGTIAAAIEPELGAAERERAARRPPEDLEAWGLYQRGLDHWYRFTEDDIAEARRLFEAAAAADRRFAPPLGALAYTYVLDYVFGFSDAPADSIAKAVSFGRKAIAIDDKDPMGHVSLGRALTLMAEHESAISELELAIELSPNLALAHFCLGVALTWSGRAEDAIAPLDTAIRLSPHDPQLWTMQNISAVAHVVVGRYERAADMARAACRHPNANFWAYAILTSALGHLGRTADAQAARTKLLELRPDFSRALWRKSMPPDTPVTEPYWAGLIRAGIDDSGVPPES